jgi:hypothetical protein
METAKMPTTDDWIKKMSYLYTMEFYSAIKKDEILLFAGKYMELVNIILNEVIQVQKAKGCMFSLNFPITNTSNIIRNIHRTCIQKWNW